MDLRLRNWNRRWFVLKDTELKYYKPNKRALKGVINLDSWCKLIKGQTMESFQLVTPKKTYHLVCKSEQECDEWVQGTYIYANVQLGMTLGPPEAMDRKANFQIGNWQHFELQ